uniref:Phorbol-ester/DAG-type domain-containing protein n=1 Tax=Leersia perrieri TaxID=77586 RepID=A0A0D9X1E2_9ORYZ
MAAAQRRYFAHPQHLLLRTTYKSTSRQACDICCAKLSGLVGYRCNACDFDIHEACADYFKETISFFAHPWHTLTLSCMPTENKGSICDLCREVCPTGKFVYRCIQCAFDVHPLCTLLPQTIRSPLHPQHDLNMVPATGHCSACREDLDVWHYRCGFCLYKVHIRCVSGVPSSGASQITNAAQNNALAQRSRSTAVTKFLLKQSFMFTINLATGGLASPVLAVLEAALD